MEISLLHIIFFFYCSVEKELRFKFHAIASFYFPMIVKTCVYSIVKSIVQQKI